MSVFFLLCNCIGLLSIAFHCRGDPTAKEPVGSVVKIESPVLNAEELAEIAATPFISMHTLSTVYPIQTAPSVGGLQVITTSGWLLGTP